MRLDTFRRMDRFDRRIRQLERVEPAAGGGGGGDHTDADHAGAFSPLAHVHAVHADSDHDDRFSLLAHSHGAPGAHTHDWADVTGEPSTFPPDEHDSAHDDRFSLLAHTHTAHPDSDHDDRFALIAAGVPTGGTAGQVLTKDTGTDYDTPQTGAAHADSDHDDRFSLLAHTHTGPSEVAYAQITAAVTVTVTTAATSILVVEAPAVTYSAVPYEFEFFSPHVSAPLVAGASVNVSLYDGAAASPVGRLCQVRTPSATAATGVPVSVKFRLTPSAGSHTYQVRAHLSTAGTGTVHAGAAAGDVFVPAYIQVTRL